MPVTSLLVGCPVRRRAWIMHRWFDHVEVAAAVARLPVAYAFAVGPGDETIAVIAERAPHAHLEPVIETEPYVERSWHREDRIRHMVFLRNLLLTHVREVAPLVYLSLDSDVLLHPQAIADMIEGFNRFDAVGGATFMSRPGPPGRPSLKHPNRGWISGHSGLRVPPVEHCGVIPVGVIMAIKALSAKAYAVDYAYNHQGEDVGWSLAAAKAGVRLGWDNRRYSKHVMSPQALGSVDERVGF